MLNGASPRRAAGLAIVFALLWADVLAGCTVDIGAEMTAESFRGQVMKAEKKLKPSGFSPETMELLTCQKVFKKTCAEVFGDVSIKAAGGSSFLKDVCMGPAGSSRKYFRSDLCMGLLRYADDRKQYAANADLLTLALQQRVLDLQRHRESPLLPDLLSRFLLPEAKLTPLQCSLMVEISVAARPSGQREFINTEQFKTQCDTDNTAKHLLTSSNYDMTIELMRVVARNGPVSASVVDWAINEMKNVRKRYPILRNLRSILKDKSLDALVSLPLPASTLKPLQKRKEWFGLDYDGAYDELFWLVFKNIEHVFQPSTNLEDMSPYEYYTYNAKKALRLQMVRETDIKAMPLATVGMASKIKGCRPNKDPLALCWLIGLRSHKHMSKAAHALLGMSAPQMTEWLKDQSNAPEQPFNDQSFCDEVVGGQETTATWLHLMMTGALSVEELFEALPVLKSFVNEPNAAGVRPLLCVDPWDRNSKANVEALVDNGARIADATKDVQGMTNYAHFLASNWFNRPGKMSLSPIVHVSSRTDIFLNKNDESGQLLRKYLESKDEFLPLLAEKDEQDKLPCYGAMLGGNTETMLTLCTPTACTETPKPDALKNLGIFKWKVICRLRASLLTEIPPLNADSSDVPAMDPSPKLRGSADSDGLSKVGMTIGKLFDPPTTPIHSEKSFRRIQAPGFENGAPEWMSSVSFESALDAEESMLPRASSTNTQRISEVPYELPSKRVEINLKTGEVFNTLGDRGGKYTTPPKTYVAGLFEKYLPRGERFNEDKNYDKYLWVLTNDYRMIIAPEVVVMTMEALPQGRVTKHGDLAPLRQAPKVSAEDGTATALAEHMITYGVHDRRSKFDVKFQSYCKELSQRFVDSGFSEEIADMPKFGEKDFLGTCRGPARMAGELYAVYDAELSNAGSVDWKYSATEQFSLTRQRKQGDSRKWRWMIDGASSYMFQRIPGKPSGGDDVDSPDRMEYPTFANIQLLASLLDEAGIDTSNLFVNIENSYAEKAKRGSQLETYSPDDSYMFVAPRIRRINPARRSNTAVFDGNDKVSGLLTKEEREKALRFSNER